MATRSKYFCDLCEKNYDFKSRYDRHLASAGHRNLEELLNHQPVDETSDPAVEQDVVRSSSPPRHVQPLCLDVLDY